MMSEEKQIEELAHIVSNAIKTWVYEAPPTSNPHFVAAAIYDANYRKQSEGKWILQQNGKGVCSKCNRQDNMDELACFCRYCGARMKGGAE